MNLINLPTRHIRRTFIAIVTMLITLSLLWCVLWGFAAAHYRHVIQGWIDSGRGEGYQIDYSDQHLFGFPRHITMRFINVQWRNNDNIVFHADDIDISARPWQTHVFDARFKNHVQITAPLDTSTPPTAASAKASDTAIDIPNSSLAPALILGGYDGRAHVELDDNGFWKLSRIELTNAEIGQTPNHVVTAAKLEASAERPIVPPTDHSQPGLTLSGNAEGVTLPEAMPSPFGATMQKLDVEMRVMGAVPDFRRRDSTDQWNKDSGIVEFDRLAMEWGPLRMTARGTVGFDDDLQPEGAFVGLINNHDAVLQALMEHDFIPKQQAAMLQSALNLFAKPTKLDRDPAIEIPISVQLGGFFFGPVRLFMFPQLVWPDSNAAPADAPASVTP
jgi:hypothetical protein